MEGEREGERGGFMNTTAAKKMGNTVKDGAIELKWNTIITKIKQKKTCYADTVM